MDWLLPITVAAPLGGAILILIIGKFWKNFGSFWTLITTFGVLVVSIRLLGEAPMVYKIGGWYPPLGIALYMDSLTNLMLLVVNIVAFAAAFFSFAYMKQYTAEFKYYSLFLLMLAGMNGVVVTGDLFNLFVFFEIASIASYALVGFGVESEELEAAFKYLVISSLASTMVLLGVAIVYAYTGTLNMADAANYLNIIGTSKGILFAIGLFIMGFGTKAALAPFHAWLPDAHPAAPAPISAMLSGVLIKSLGVYALARVLYSVFGLNPTASNILLVLGGLSVLVGVLPAVGQADLKRMLAYCSISQIGYIVIGIGLGTPLGIAGGLFHLANHGIYKSLLFLNSGSIEYELKTRHMKKMGGILKEMPVTGTTTAIGSLAISGIPPLNGFWSKILIILATIQSHKYILTATAAFETFVTILIFAKVFREVLLGEKRVPFKLKEVPFPMAFATSILALVCICMGLLYPIFLNTIFYPAQNALLDRALFIKTLLGG